MWEQVKKLDNPQASPTTALLKTWVMGFAKNYRGPYLPSTMARDIIVPTAKDHKIIGYVPPPGQEFPPDLEDLPTDPLAISVEEEAALLSEPITPSVPSGRSRVSLLGGEGELSMETEDIPSYSASERITPSPCEDPPERPDEELPPSLQNMLDRLLGTFMQGVNKNIDAQQRETESRLDSMHREAESRLDSKLDSSQRKLDSLACEIQASASLIKQQMKVLSTPSTSEGVPDPPPAEDPKNPWRPCAWLGLSADGTKVLSPSGNLEVRGLEFFPSFNAFPNCYFRWKPSFDCEAIPDEIELLPMAEATTLFSKLCLGTGATNTQLQSFKSKKPVRVTAEGKELPFLGKAIKALSKALKADQLPCAQPKESEMVGLLVPRKTEIFPEWEGCAEAFTVQSLDKSIASLQLQESFPEIPPDLLREEYRCRREAADAITFAACLEGLSEASELVNADLDLGRLHWILGAHTLLSRLHFRRLVSALNNFALAKVACRRYVLAACKIRHEPRLLITSNIFCKGLFPEALVADILGRASRESRNLSERWRIPTRTGFRRPLTPNRNRTQSQSPGPSSGAIPKRGKIAHRGGQHSPSPGPSPAANPRRDSQPPQRFQRNRGGRRRPSRRGSSGRGSSGRGTPAPTQQ